MTTAETESKRQYQRKSNCKKLTVNENETDASNKENQGQKDQADDRSEFAVQPGRKVGTTEQSDEKVVYLTLDDGPSKNTQAVLTFWINTMRKQRFLLQEPCRNIKI